ncbi:hypothetical protein DL765_003549 [Monosporascus sp. GIB2]|nr:hypothetical protein DL765_003549 [Monosporascus sp. GIB2]
MQIVSASSNSNSMAFNNDPLLQGGMLGIVISRIANNPVELNAFCRGGRNRGQSFDDVLEKAELNKDLNDNENFLLLPPRLLGYATRGKIWGQFGVDSADDPGGKDPTGFTNDLQLDQKYKDLIEALVESHEAGADTEARDPVEGKGKGLVLLLHETSKASTSTADVTRGPPGVGKTLTAETVAAKTGRPLFVVSVAEIRLNASRAERNLEKLFKLATKWEAILLVHR